MPRTFHHLVSVTSGPLHDYATNKPPKNMVSLAHACTWKEFPNLLVNLLLKKEVAQ